MKLDVNKFTNGFRKAIGRELDPSELQAVLLFLIAKTGDLEQFYDLAEDSIETKPEEEALTAVRRDIESYKRRLDEYLAFTNECISRGDFSIDCVEPVLAPLMQGLYSNKTKLPGGSPICWNRANCYTSGADLGTPIRIMNQLAEVVDFNAQQWGEFFHNSAEAAYEVASTAAGAGVPLPDLDDVPEAWEDVKQGVAKGAKFLWDLSVPGQVQLLSQGDAKARSVKWALVGGGTALAALALFKLLK